MEEPNQPRKWTSLDLAVVSTVLTALVAVFMFGPLFYYAPLLAIAGIVTGLLAAVLNRSQWSRVRSIIAIDALLLCLCVLVFMPMPSNYDPKQKTCVSNLRQVSTALLAYAQDWDGRLPLASNWNTAVVDYTKSKYLLVCPAANNDMPSLALNKSLSGRSVEDLAHPGEMPLAFDSVPGRNRAGYFLLTPRHEGGANVSFADGHVKWLLEAEAKKAFAKRIELLPKVKKDK